MKQTITWYFKREIPESRYSSTRLRDDISTLEAFERRHEDAIKHHFGKQPKKNVLNFGSEIEGMRLLKEGKIQPRVEQRRGYEAVIVEWNR